MFKNTQGEIQDKCIHAAAGACSFCYREAQAGARRAKELQDEILDCISPGWRTLGRYGITMYGGGLKEFIAKQQEELKRWQDSAAAPISEWLKERDKEKDAKIAGLEAVVEDFQEAVDSYECTQDEYIDGLNNALSRAKAPRKVLAGALIRITEREWVVLAKLVSKSQRDAEKYLSGNRTERGRKYAELRHGALRGIGDKLQKAKAAALESAKPEEKEGD